MSARIAPPPRACDAPAMPPHSAHTSRDFETELRELRAQALAMGARCERIVQLALDAFWSSAPSARAVIESVDAQIDRDEIDLHALAMRILALRQPVAADLRFVAAALRLITDLERIGDEAVNISERASEGDADAKNLVRADLESMGSMMQDMLRDALQAFVDRDPAAAERVLARDDRIDSLCSSIITSMTEHIARRSDEVRPGLRVIRVTKYVERIADHATNIAEEVIFMVRGDDVRHGQYPPAGAR
jgi:phosphate transport system protein